VRYAQLFAMGGYNGVLSQSGSQYYCNLDHSTMCNKLRSKRRKKKKNKMHIPEKWKE
jgi:hypothetical protein